MCSNRSTVKCRPAPIVGQGAGSALEISLRPRRLDRPVALHAVPRLPLICRPPPALGVVEGTPGALEGHPPLTSSRLLLPFEEKVRGGGEAR